MHIPPLALSLSLIHPHKSQASARLVKMTKYSVYNATYHIRENTTNECTLGVDGGLLDTRCKKLAD